MLDESVTRQERSIVHLPSLLAKVQGQTGSPYVRRRRLQWCCELLVHRDLTHHGAAVMTFRNLLIRVGSLITYRTLALLLIQGRAWL
jgi:hypothetical protein